MQLVEKLRERAKAAENQIWSNGYQQHQEDLRALLTEAADKLEQWQQYQMRIAQTVEGVAATIDAALESNAQLKNTLNG